MTMLDTERLLSLTGGLPPLIPAPKFVSGLAKKWTLSQLKRPDGLELRHWKREDNLQSNYLVLSHSPNGRIEESGIDNRFDKFGVAPDIVAYSEQEYTMHLQDQSWTREETDYLFSLYREFDARCVVIADRYEFPSKPRTLEEIRDRYSEVNRKLIIARAGPGDHSYKADLYKFAYDKYKDTQRRKHLVNLYERTAEQIHQEEVLFRELKRREANEESWLRERESLLRRLKESENIPAGSQFLVPGEGLVKKKRKTSRDESGQKRKRTFADSSAVDLSADDSAPRRDRSGAPNMVHLRSTQLGISRHTLQRITPVFEEFSVPLKPHMATESVCEEYGKLRDHATTILDLRKQLEKAEHDLKVAQAKTGGAGDDPKKGEKKRQFSSPKGTPRDVKRSRTS